ncbi:hypothetical protein ACJ41O_003161 [Fusarium nematophilum]
MVELVDVDLGQNAPTKQEGAGDVPSESLAAQSYAEGGDYASNEGMRSENLPSKSTFASKPANAGQDAPSAGRDAPQSTGTAPSYSQTLKEGGGWDDSKDEDGLQRALNAEPGSDDDPSRLAEQQFRRQSGGAGPREKDLKTKTVYDTLDSETPS